MNLNIAILKLKGKHFNHNDKANKKYSIPGP